MRRYLKYILPAIPVLAIAGYILKPSPGTTLGQRVNADLDNALALATRILELPTALLFAAVLVLAVLATVGFHLRPTVAEAAASNPTRRRWRNVAITLVILCTLITLALGADLRLHRLQNEVLNLRAQVSNNRMNANFAAPNLPHAPTPTPNSNAQLPVPAASPPAPALTQTPAHVSPAPGVADKRDKLLVDVDAAQRTLTQAGASLQAKTRIVNNSIDAVQLQFSRPLAVAYLAVVDLKAPGTEIVLGTNLGSKTLTSSYAQSEKAVLAINGEAGNSPAANSGLGPWTGYLVNKGKTLLNELPNNPRPFLHFDKENTATYRAMASSDRKLPANPNTVIWGRHDALIDGTAQASGDLNRQPRTTMGIDKDGTKLYLFVVDGRQPQYSLGMTRFEVGAILKAFGAHNAMLCDEGGSSTMYIQPLGGVLNSPSDGEERPTYTHFAVRAQ